MVVLLYWEVRHGRFDRVFTVRGQGLRAAYLSLLPNLSLGVLSVYLWRWIRMWPWCLLCCAGARGLRIRGRGFTVTFRERPVWGLPCQQALKKSMLRGDSRSGMVRDAPIGGRRAVKACGYRVQICAIVTRVQGGVAARGGRRYRHGVATRVRALGVVGAGWDCEPRENEGEDAEEECGAHHAE